MAENIAEGSVFGGGGSTAVRATRRRVAENKVLGVLNSWGRHRRLERRPRRSAETARQSSRAGRGHGRAVGPSAGRERNHQADRATRTRGRWNQSRRRGGGPSGTAGDAAGRWATGPCRTSGGAPSISERRAGRVAGVRGTDRFDSDGDAGAGCVRGAVAGARARADPPERRIHDRPHRTSHGRDGRGGDRSRGSGGAADHRQGQSALPRNGRDAQTGICGSPCGALSAWGRTRRGARHRATVPENRQ